MKVPVNKLWRLICMKFEGELDSLALLMRWTILMEIGIKNFEIET